jgi:triacylglycerol lipase
MSPQSSNDIWPPSLAYPYFAKAAANPFRPGARRFRRVNASWLMDLSLLVYVQDRDFVRTQLKKVSLDASVEFVGFDQPFLSTQALVAWSDRAVFVVFRGTEIRGVDRAFNIIADWVTDALIFLVPIEGGAFVHFGFLAAVSSVWDSIADVLDVVGRGRHVWFAGHSLGAACATLAAYRYRVAGSQAWGIYTFGSPRVGDATLKAKLGVRANRVVQGRDLVTTVPGFGPHDGLIYRHVGEAHYLADDGSIGPNPPPNLPLFVPPTLDGPGGPITRAIIDHSPVLYAKLLARGLDG